MYTFSLWDKKSHINGISAEVMLLRHNITTSEVGIVIDDNNVVCVFQYDNTNPYNQEEALDVVRKIAEEANNPPPPPYDEISDIKQAINILMGEEL